MKVPLPAEWEAVAEPQLRYQGNSAYIPRSSPLTAAAFLLDNS